MNRTERLPFAQWADINRTEQIYFRRSDVGISHGPA